MSFKTATLCFSSQPSMEARGEPPGVASHPGCHRCCSLALPVPDIFLSARTVTARGASRS